MSEPTTHTDVLVVGAGQAGLSISWLLGQAGVDHLVVDAATAVHEWSDSRWDAFTLVTPNWQCQLPGWHYDGPDPDGFMTRDEVVAWLSDWIASFDPPVRAWTRVHEVKLAADGGFDVTLAPRDGAVETLHARQVVVATGGYHRPIMPAFARAIHPAIHQIHSQQYLRPDQLPDGAVLVVGTGQSGAQIAEDLHLAGRQVHLAVGSAPRVARTYRGRDCMTWLSDMGLYDTPVAVYPGGLAAREKTNHYVTGRDGGHDIDLRAFAREGMQLYGTFSDAQGTVLSFEPTLRGALDSADAVYNSICSDIDRYIAAHGIDAPPAARYEPVWRPDHEPRHVDVIEADITSIVWAIGFRADYSWLRVGVFDGAGRPTHHRGVTATPGLYFVGLPWMHTWGSGRFLGVERDARHVAQHVIERAGSLADCGSPEPVGSALLGSPVAGS